MPQSASQCPGHVNVWERTLQSVFTCCVKCDRHLQNQDLNLRWAPNHHSVFNREKWPSLDNPNRLGQIKSAGQMLVLAIR